jgi:hypothetical protein
MTEYVMQPINLNQLFVFVNFYGLCIPWQMWIVCHHRIWFVDIFVVDNFYIFY